MSKTAILLVSHGRLAEGLLDAAVLILGEAEGIFTASINQGEAPEMLDDRLKNAAEAIEKGGFDRRILILTDLFGATPSNASLRVLGDRAIVVTGMNLGMLLETIQARESDDSIEELAHVACGNGRESIREVSL